MGKRKKYTAEEKLAAVLDSYTTGNVGEAAVRAGVHTNQLSKWRKQLVTRGGEIYKNKRGNNQHTNRSTEERLQRIIGKQAVQIDFLERVHELMS